MNKNKLRCCQKDHNSKKKFNLKIVNSNSHSTTMLSSKWFQIIWSFWSGSSSNRIQSFGLYYQHQINDLK